MLVTPEDTLGLHQISVDTPVVIMPTRLKPLDEWIEAFEGTVTKNDPEQGMLEVTVKGRRVVALTHEALGFVSGSSPYLSLISPEASKKYAGVKMSNESHRVIFPTTKPGTP